MMNAAERSVREAASALLYAITSAEFVGLRVEFPRSAHGLASIAISETGKAVTPLAPKAEKPKRAKKS